MSQRIKRWHQELGLSASYFEKEELSDVLFVFPTDSSVQIPGHRFLLSLRSRAFCQAFEASVTAKASPNTRFPIKIVVKDTKPLVFKALLRFLYTNELPIQETGQLCFHSDILRAAYLYQVPSLTEYLVLEKLLPILSDNKNNALSIAATVDQILGIKTSTKQQEGLLIPDDSQFKSCKGALEHLSLQCEVVMRQLTADEFKQILCNSEVLNLCTTSRILSLLRKRSSRPLLLAIECQIIRAVEALVLDNEPIDDTDYYVDEELPLVSAIRVKNDRIIRILLRGKKINELEEKDTPSMLHVAAASGSLIHCKLLIENGADTNSLQSHKTPLHVASLAGEAEIVKLLLEAGAVPNLQDSLGNTALHFAATEATALELLTAAKKSVNIGIPNSRGQVALHVAAATGDVSVLNLLLQHGADQYVTDDQGQNALHIAAANGHAAVVLILLKYAEEAVEAAAASSFENSTEVESTSNAASEESNKILQLLKVINLPDAKGNTALHLGCMSAPPGMEKVVRFLLENGADPNIGNWFSQTPLHLFCAHQGDGHASIIEKFVESGASLRMQSGDGSTPLHLAVGRPSEENTIALVRAGAQLHFRDLANRSVIELAESSSLGSMVVPMLRNVAKPPEWISDEAVKQCSTCGLEFSVATRRHHCRHCGLIICYNCSSNSIALPKFQINKPVRVCQLCYDVLSFRRLQ